MKPASGFQRLRPAILVAARTLIPQKSVQIHYNSIRRRQAVRLNAALTYPFFLHTAGGRGGLRHRGLFQPAGGTAAGAGAIPHHRVQPQNDGRRQCTVSMLSCCVVACYSTFFSHLLKAIPPPLDPASVLPFCSCDALKFVQHMYSIGYRFYDPMDRAPKAKRLWTVLKDVSADFPV